MFHVKQLILRGMSVQSSCFPNLFHVRAERLPYIAKNLFCSPGVTEGKYGQLLPSGRQLLARVFGEESLLSSL